MAHLTLAGVSDDGERLLLVDDQGAEFTLDITPGLRSALRGDRSRVGQLEIQMESVLRPRDIQARIRSGEPPESVAQAAHTTVEAIMPFVGPVLAERQHVAERALRANLRRSSAESGAARGVGEAVDAHLRSLNVDPGVVEWDSWRREDGRWAVTASYATTGRQGSAEFTYDAPGNYVTSDNDDARWLVGDAVPDSAPAIADPAGRRLSAVPDTQPHRGTSLAADELPLGDDAIEMVSEDSPDEALPLADEPAAPSGLAPATASGDAAVTDDEPATAPADDQPDEAPRRQVNKRKGRASVPSWDEIMFGGSGDA